jgi:hypothetical protein
MSEPTIAQIFGTGATRLANAAPAPSSGLFIPDSVFTAAGLSSPSTATSEGLLIALILQSKSYLSQTNFDGNIDQSIYLEDGFASFVGRGTNNTSYRVDSISVNLAKIDTNVTIDPNDY